jgi:hypothetical protein
MKKKIQTFKTDAKAEQFVDTADLSKYDLSGLKALKMKNPPHSGFSVRVDCLEPHGLSVTEGAKVLGVGVVKGSDPLNDSAVGPLSLCGLRGPGDEVIGRF